jgi:uncharacterized protein
MIAAGSGQSVWLVVASFLAGGLNAVAGGGSFLSFPALLGMGVMPIQANATNTVALWPGQFTSIAGYREELRSSVKTLMPLSVAALIGGLLGAIVLLRTGQAQFLRLVPWLLLFGALLFTASGPVARRLNSRSSNLRQSHPHHVLLFISTLAVCFYIGYFGAGAGFLIMSVLALFGIEEINRINAIKVVTTTLANGIAVVTFVVRGQVAWRYCVLMMVAAAIGGYVGARGSRRLDGRIVRAIVVVIGLGMAAYFFWKLR